MGSCCSTNTLNNCTNENTLELSFVNKQMVGKVLEVTDGDTVIIAFELLPSHFFRTSCRLAGIDAAEIHTLNPNEKKVGNKAKDYLENILLNKVVSIHCSRDEDKYGRGLLATLFLAGKNINEEMVSKGYAYHFDGHSKKKKFEEWYKGEIIGPNEVWNCCESKEMPINQCCKTCYSWHCFCTGKHNPIHRGNTAQCRRCHVVNPNMH